MSDWNECKHCDRKSDEIAALTEQRRYTAKEHQEHARIWMAERHALMTTIAELRKALGIDEPKDHAGCNYQFDTNGVCNKCGQVRSKE